MHLKQVRILMKKVSEAPVWYGAEQADAWADGYNSALEGYSPIPDPYRDTVKKLAAVREKRLAELVEENAQLRAELAKKRPETLPGTIAEVYGDLDAEDCAMIDREWARWRGYILPTDGTSTLSRPAPQKVPLPTPANLWRDAAVFPVPLSHSTEAPQVPEVSAATGDEPDSRLPLQYEDGPDYCTVKDAQGRDFALTMQPELMRAMERALREDISRLSQPPVTPTEPQPSSCLNCGDPSHEPFCGTCREMGCTNPLGELLAKICAHEAVNEAMADSWNDICSDTGCHPLDIEHGKGKHLTFSPNHWANQVAKRLFVRALRLREKPSLPVKNDRGAEPQASADTEAELGLYDLGESFLAEYERATKDGCLKNFVCAESPVEVLWHLINKVDELRLEIDQLRALRQAVARPPIALGDMVYMNERSPYFHDWKGVSFKVVSLRSEPDGKLWASVIEGEQRHRGNGVYDAETTDVDAEYLSPLSGCG